jgi:hypothetical protein
MSHKKTNEYLGEATLSSVMKEMARPRLAASVREGSGRTVTARGKFPVGALLHNRNTKEDGLVTKVYQLGGGGGGDIMYEVAVPIHLNTWAGGHYVSDWSESTLNLSDNVTLKSADKPPTRDWP